jgi:hypothetical protein
MTDAPNTFDSDFLESNLLDDDELERARVEAELFWYDDLLFACSNLCDLLEVENEALLSHDPETVRLLADNKAALARLYEQSVQPLVDEPDLARLLDEDRREMLVAVGTRLNELMETNARRLKAEMEAYQRVMDIMVDAAKKNVTSTTAYGKAGLFDAAAGTGGSLSFNKAL